MARPLMKIHSPPCLPPELGDAVARGRSDEWTKARLALLAQEKELTRLRDAISQQRHHDKY